MSSGQDTGFSCTCGALKGHIRNLSPSSGTHAVCFCPDCRAAEAYFKQPDPGSNGISLVQLNPDDVVFDEGEEHLAVARLYPSGVLRWHADCCKAPLFNTVATPKVRFATLLVKRLEHPERVGPVRAQAFVPRPGKKPRHKNAMRLIWPADSWTVGWTGTTQRATVKALR